MKDKWRYFNWICQVMHADDPDHGLMHLMAELYSIEFTWTVDMDENRAMDGIALRENWFMADAEEAWDRAPCSVLEMMAALAIRIDEEIMWDPDEGERAHIWFWEMVSNLGLGELDDSVWSWESRALVEEAVLRMTDRTYSTDGIGGLFPMPGCREDQREVEIWYQMQRYFAVRYGVKDDLKVF